MSEQPSHPRERSQLDPTQLSGLLRAALAMLAGFWAARPEDDTEIDWEDGEIDEERDRA
jgi:hypothetical protein